MATAKVNGVDYTIQPNVKSSGAANNSGVTTKAGASVKLTNVQVSRFNSTVFASTVIDNSWADKVLDSGAFAYNNTKPVGKRVTSSLAGVSNTALRSGADRPSLIRSIHKLEVLRTRRFTTAIRTNKYNRYTNVWVDGFPVVAVDTLATDTAATPTRAVPGQLTYKLGNPVPVTNNDYKAKTS